MISYKVPSWCCEEQESIWFSLREKRKEKKRTTATAGISPEDACDNEFDDV
jgi:hypothetical protein